MIYSYHFGMYKQIWFCRWCGQPYKPNRETERDGFCCPAHKQAHHRAFKRWQESAQHKRYRPAIEAAPIGNDRSDTVTQAKSKKKAVSRLPSQGKRKTLRRSRTKTG